MTRQTGSRCCQLNLKRTIEQVDTATSVGDLAGPGDLTVAPVCTESRGGTLRREDDAVVGKTPVSASVALRYVQSTGTHTHTHLTVTASPLQLAD